MNKLLSIITAIILCFAMTACGETGTDTAKKSTDETTTTAETSTETTTTATAITTTAETTTTTAAETEPPVEEEDHSKVKTQEFYAPYYETMDWLENKVIYRREFDENGNITAFSSTAFDYSVNYEYEFNDEKNKAAKNDI